jgi:hypothetical protein
LLFEVIGLTALALDFEVLAAIALSGAAMTKVEGAVFVALAIIAYAVTRRRFSSAVRIALPAAILLASWIGFARHYHLIDSYGMAQGSIHPDVLGRVLKETLASASYGVAWVPWLAPIAVLIIHRNFRPALLPLIVAAGTFLTTVFYYLHSESPDWWIAASAQRVLLTPLACLVVATAIRSE